jgi:caffeoyl-CoA O-methyltransferase
MSEPLSYRAVQDFVASLVPPRPEEMVAMEKYAQSKEFPIIGPAAGYACYQVARMIGARSVFEMGSGYGYSTAWFAQAVQENCAETGSQDGVVHHVVWDAKLSEMAVGHLSKLGLNGRVRYHIAEAVETLTKLPGPFDLIFNDIDKKGYPGSLAVIKERLRKGGVLITDNILWSGRVFDSTDQSETTEGVREFTRMITSDPDWIVSMWPVRDGLIVALKK